MKPVEGLGQRNDTIWPGFNRNTGSCVKNTLKGVQGRSGEKSKETAA